MEGNDADVKTGVNPVCESRLGCLFTGLCGGVGGVEIQIGVESNMCSDMFEPGGTASPSWFTTWAGIERSPWLDAISTSG
jgi:hypothetical protein